MQRWLAVLVSFGIVCVALTWAPAARACGGCFVQQSRNTQVTAHRMALSISQEQTTLWDQIEYVGDPGDFAWVLPIKGQVEVGLSSDLLFETLEALTAVQVVSPSVPCSFGSGSGGPSGFGPCSTGYAATAAAAGGFGSATQTEEEGVEILVQEVVGPYETVQLSATDPQALRSWLDDHGYAVPADIEPVIDAYVADQFDFLALRLVPGVGVDAMRPVRITTPGASPLLPLRMVAAGTGANTAIALFILGEGGYAPTNMPWSTVDPLDLVWDFDQQRSNYSELRAAYFTSTGGSGWLAEAARAAAPASFSSITQAAVQDPQGSGYAAPDGTGAPEAAAEDIATLIGNLDPGSIVITRHTAFLARASLGIDLTLGASSEVLDVPPIYFVETYTGDPCADFAGACGQAPSTGAGAGSPFGVDGDGEDGQDGAAAHCDCGVAGAGDAAPLWLVAAAVAAAARRRLVGGRRHDAGDRARRSPPA